MCYTELSKLQRKDSKPIPYSKNSSFVFLIVLNTLPSPQNPALGFFLRWRRLRYVGLSCEC